MIKPYIAGVGFASLLATSLAVPVQASEVSYNGRRITIRCNNESLGQVFDQVKASTGVELILDGAVRNTRLSANIVDEPVNVALERLLEGSGLNYVMLMDRADWQRVAKMYIGSSGTSGGGSSPAAARSAPPIRRPAREVEEEEPEPAPEEPAPAEDFGDSDQGQSADENAGENQPGQPPPGMAPAPNYLPQPQVFPRSSFTPGIEKNPFGAPSTAPLQPGSAYPYGMNPYGGPSGANPPGSAPAGTPPPANFPFVDAFGRPIPVPQQQQNKNPKD